MKDISDEYMQQHLAASKEYCIVILRTGPAWDPQSSRSIVWEHGRRNFALRAAGKLAIVCRAADESDLAGIGIFNAPLEEVQQIMNDDPAVKAGVLVYEAHPARGFPGDSLPG